MHLYMITRGIKHDVDRFIQELAAKYLPYKVMSGAAGLPAGEYMLQTSVRPIQMWEIAFPKEHLDLMLGTFTHPDCEQAKLTQHPKKHQKWLALIRKALGVKPIPKEWENKGTMPLYRKNTECALIGIKDDYDFKDGTEAI